MLGYVKQIKSYSLNIALPNGLLGSVPITKISHAYTESLQKFSEAEGENVEVILFSPIINNRYLLDFGEELSGNQVLLYIFSRWKHKFSRFLDPLPQLLH